MHKHIASNGEPTKRSWWRRAGLAVLRALASGSYMTPGLPPPVRIED
jgi:hypothetical protein